MEEDEKPNRGRPWLGDKPRKRYNVVLDPEVKENAQAEAKKEGLSLSMWIEKAILAKLRKK